MRRIPCLRVLFGLLLSVFVISAAAAAPIATTTTLTASPSGSSSFHDLVVLTATVVDANHAPVLSGTVTFSNGSASLGTVQMVATSSGGHTPGTATLRLTSLPTGTNSLTATFNGTNADAASSSAAQSFTVSAASSGTLTVNNLASTGNVNGSYGLTATVHGYGTTPLTGSVTFTDSTSGTNLGSGTLTAMPGSPGFLPVLASLPTGAGAQLAATGDFNNDGNVDMLFQTFGTFRVNLGNGDDTFSAGASYLGLSNYDLLSSVGDFNQDGNLDAVIENSVAGSSSLFLYLGNGDGTFQTPINI